MSQHRSASPTEDQQHMARAIALAATAGPAVRPNPRVGCVLVRHGIVVGEGAHERCGGPHAEAVALAQAGEAARGATAFVTLEPCAHTGRTPPCALALIEAGVQRVVIASADPHETAAGGAELLRRAGVDVELGLMAREARDVAEVFFVNVLQARPHVTLKIAATMDGHIAAEDGTSQWISGAPARARVHKMRADADAVMVGSGTALADNPRLTPRDVDVAGPAPLRVVMDRRLRIAPESFLCDVSLAPTLVCTSSDDEAQIALLRARGVDVWRAPHSDDWLVGALRGLKERGVFSVLCEGGSTLAAALLRRGLVDRLEVVSAPVLLGSGLRAWGDLGIATLTAAQRWRWCAVEAVGADLWATARPLADAEE